MKYPKDLEANLKRRYEVVTEAENNLEVQLLLKEQCRNDVLFFFNMFVYTYDPRRPIVRNIPFITYPYQDDTILWDKQVGMAQEDNLFEKTRDVGASWMFITDDLHDWLFSKEKLEIRWGSRKEQYVDTRGDMDSIFEKFRHILRNMPEWMRPKGFDWKEHDNSMRLINPETTSSITGEATNANFGRGGRKYRIRFDEFAFWENDERAWQSAADATNCRCALSTPNGASNKFALLAKSPIKKMALHWTLHPLKNKGVYRYDVESGQKVPIDITHDSSAAFKIWQEVRLTHPPAHFIGGLIRSKWYDAECERRGSAKEVAEELDIDYARSGMPFFDLRMLSKQVPWTIMYRNFPTARIPHGRYILVNLVDIDNKMEVRDNRAGWLRVYEMPVPDGQYVLSGDIAEGLEKADECFGVVREKWSRNVVADCNGLYDPDDFAVKLQKLGAFYNKAMTAPENNNHGYSVCSDLKQVDCNLYWTRKRHPKTREVTRVKAGWTTTAQSRPEMLDQAKEEVRKISNEIRSSIIIGQMGTFVHNEKTGKLEGTGKFKDDGVIAYAIGSAVIKEYPYTPKPPPRIDTSRVNRGRGHFAFGTK